jgi:two-component system, NtrC family, response regulator
MRFCKQNAIPIKGISPEIIEAMQSYEWDGNVRELVRAVEFAVVKAGAGGILFPKHLPEHIRIRIAKSTVRSDLKQNTPLEDCGGNAILEPLKQIRKNAADRAEKEYLKELLSVVGADFQHACKMSGLSRSRFYELLNKHGLAVSE